MTTMQDVIYTQRQPSPAWVHALFVAMILGLLAAVAVPRLRPRATGPGGTPVALTGPAVGLVVVVLMWVLIPGTRTTVTREQVLVHFGRWPNPVRIAVADIQSCRPVTYRPLWQFGGWGIRRSWNGVWAYTARGNRGLLLYLSGERRVLLGSDDPARLASALAQVGIRVLPKSADLEAPPA